MLTRKVPKIIGIDGVDGAGKNTVSNFIKLMLESEGYKVALISPPFYETETGKVVKDYLTKGYGQMRDRRVASALYSIDRNMYYRDHFDELFVDCKYDYIIYNRNWLSNLLFQTTMVYQSVEDAMLFRHVASPWADNPDGATYAFRDRCDSEIMDLTIQELLKMAETSPFGEDLKTFCWYQRLVMVVEHMKFIYNLEIAPWTVTGPGIGRMFPKQFPEVYEHINLVLTPQHDPDGITSGATICQRNLNARYEEDRSKIDRNEASSAYLDSVIENIYWIHNAFLSVAHSDEHDLLINDPRYIDSIAKRCHIEGFIHHLPKEELGLIDYFDYCIIPTTKTIDGELVQNSINENVAAACDALVTHGIISRP